MTFSQYLESDFCSVSAAVLVLPSSNDNWIDATIKSLNKDTFQDDCVDCLIIQCCFVIICARHASDFSVSFTLSLTQSRDLYSYGHIHPISSVHTSLFLCILFFFHFLS